jgi:hypothetical protein
VTPDEELGYALTYLADITAPDGHAATLIDAAVYYASIGWPVFPLHPGRREPLGRLAPKGLHDATTDPGAVAAWWSDTPDANIGLRTGDRFDVVDLDVKDGRDGVGSFWDLCQRTGQTPRLLGSTLTTTGGRHLLIAPTGKGNLQNVGAAPGEKTGVDYRGTGGYIVAPPSVIDGRLYTWIVAPAAELTGAAA